MKNAQKFTARKLSLTAAMLALLVACSGPHDVKLSEMNEPQNTKKLQEVLTGEERQLLQSYVITHTSAGDLDYNKTVKEAIDARKAELSTAEKARSNMNQIK